MDIDKNDEEELQLDDIIKEYEPMVNDLIEEGQCIYILLRQMSFSNQKFKEKLKKQKDEYEKSLKPKQIDNLLKTLRFYKFNTGRLEIINPAN